MLSAHATYSGAHQQPRQRRRAHSTVHHGGNHLSHENDMAQKAPARRSELFVYYQCDSVLPSILSDIRTRLVLARMTAALRNSLISYDWCVLGCAPFFFLVLAVPLSSHCRLSWPTRMVLGQGGFSPPERLAPLCKRRGRRGLSTSSRIACKHGRDVSPPRRKRPVALREMRSVRLGTFRSRADF